MTDKTYQLTPVDLLILRALNRFRYLTAAQLNRVLWPDNIRDANRYAQRRLARLATDDYVHVLSELPKPSTGTAPRVHTLAWRGRKALLALGEPVPSYYRPSEVEESVRNPLYMPHTLAVIDVLVAVERLTQEVPEIRMTKLLLERDLRRLRPQVTAPGTTAYDRSRRVAVVPDALFSLINDGDGQDFILELDRGTERQHVWRDKVAAMTLWVTSPASAELLTSQHITVMVVTTAGPRRREDLRSWTAAELQARGLFDEYASIFAITDVSAVTTPPVEFFGGTHWHPPFAAALKASSTCP
jgi:protein involved in plasmid replication-relaxation